MSDVVSQSEIKSLLQDAVKDFSGQLSEEFKKQLKELKEEMNRRFDAQGTQLNGLRTDVNDLRTDVNDLKTDVNGLKTDVNDLRTDVNDLRTDVNDLRTDVNDLKTDVNGLKTDVNGLTTKVDKLTASVTEGQQIQGYILEHLARNSLKSDFTKKYLESFVVLNLHGLCKLISLSPTIQTSTSGEDQNFVNAKELALLIVENKLDAILLEEMDALITLSASTSTSSPVPVPAQSSSSSTSASNATSNSRAAKANYFSDSFDDKTKNAWKKRCEEFSKLRQEVWEKLHKLSKNSEKAEVTSMKKLLVELGETLTTMKDMKNSCTSYLTIFNFYIKFLMNSSFGLYCILAHTIKEKKKIFVSYNNALEFDCRGCIGYKQDTYFLDFGEIKATSNKKTMETASTQLLIRAAPLSYAIKKLYNPSTKIHFDLRFFFFKEKECEFNFENMIREILTEETQNLITLSWLPYRVM